MAMRVSRAVVVRLGVMNNIALLLILVAVCSAQNRATADRQTGASMHPCPGGKVGGGEIDTTSVPSLDRLLEMSDLVVVGTVLNSLPAFNRNPDHLNAIETDSQISVAERLWGTIPANGNTILLFQMGGTAGPCTEIVPQDPLVQPNEQYVFFLTADKRKVPNMSGLPRYQAVGLWSGKAQIVNGKIHFLERASSGLHKYDNTDALAFLATVREWITVLSGYNLLHTERLH